MLYIIVNPASRSGKGAAKWKEFESVLKDSSIVYKAFVTGRDGIFGIKKSLTEMISGDDKLPCVCVLGGDGTVNEALNALSEVSDRIRFVYFPTGSSNDLARALDIHSDFEAFIKEYRKNSLSEKVTDTGLLTTPDGKKRRFAVSSGIGYDAAVCTEALDSKYKKIFNRIGLGKLTYGAIAIKSLRKAPLAGAYITLDNGEELHYDEFLFGVGMIQKYEGGGIKFAPKADANDGKLDFVFAEGLKKWQVLLLLPLGIFGLHTISKHIHIIRTTSVKVKVTVPLAVHTDGEYAGTRSEVMITCEKDGLKYY